MQPFFFLLNKGKVHHIQNGLGKLVSKTNYKNKNKKELLGMVDPQSCSSSNQVSMDGTGDEKEEEAETLYPQSWSSSNRASMDGISDEKEEEEWMVPAMRK